MYIEKLLTSSMHSSFYIDIIDEILLERLNKGGKDKSCEELFNDQQNIVQQKLSHEFKPIDEAYNNVCNTIEELEKSNLSIRSNKDYHLATLFHLIRYLVLLVIIFICFFSLFSLRSADVHPWTSEYE